MMMLYIQKKMNLLIIQLYLKKKPNILQKNMHFLKIQKKDIRMVGISLIIHKIYVNLRLYIFNCYLNVKNLLRAKAFLYIYYRKIGIYLNVNLII